MQVDNIRKFAVLFFAAISFCLAIFCFVNAFRFIPPWEYTWFTPLSFLSEHAAGTVFILLSAALIALVSVFAGIEGKKPEKIGWTRYLSCRPRFFWGMPEVKSS